MPIHCRLTLCLLMLFPVAARADWPQFRGPGGDGHAPASTAELPLAWSPTRNVAWAIGVTGEAWSSPIVHDGRIYMTTAVADGDGADLRLQCHDAATGRLLWDVRAFHHPGPLPAKHNKASHANPTPICDGQRIYIHFGHLGTAAFDLAGKVIWRNEALGYEAVHGNGGSPLLYDGLLIFSADGGDRQEVIALDAATGQVRWRTPRGLEPQRGFSFSTPTLIEHDGQMQIISAGSDAVMAYDPATGREIWRVRYPGGYSVIPKPVVGHGLVFVCTGYNQPRLLAIRLGGRGDVTDTHVAWTLEKGAPHTPSLLLVGDELYMVADRGIATCLDARTGNMHWQERVGGNFSASPLFVDDRIYLQSEQGETIVLAPGHEYRELARSDMGQRSLASPAISDGAIFLRTDTHLYRIQSMMR